MKTILAPVDFSPVTSAVVARACDLARAFFGRIILLTTVQPPVVTDAYAAGLENPVGIVASATKAAGRRLEKLRREIANQFIAVETELATDFPVSAIADAEKKFAADYIVMGSHGHSAVYDLLVGTTTHGVLKRAACPVVIVPSEKVQPAKRRR